MKRLFTLVALLTSTAACQAPTVMNVLPTGAPRMTAPLQAPPLRRHPVAHPASVISGEEVELTGIYDVDENGAHFLLRNGARIDLTHHTGQFLRHLPAVENRATLRIRGRMMPNRNAFADAELVPHNYRRI